MPRHGVKLRWENRRVHTAATVIGEAVYQPGGLCGPRIQRDFQLVLLYSGECRATVNNSPLPLKRATAYLFTPGGREFFEFAPDTDSHHSWCSVRPTALPAGLRKALRQSQLSVPASERFRALIEIGLKFDPVPGSASSAFIDHLGICLFAEFLHASSMENQRTAGDPVVRVFLEHVRKHYGDETCLEAARRAAGVSRNTLIYKVQQAIRTTPARFLWNIRIERAVAMLGETGHTIAEIAYQCGFKNPFHFSRMIKQRLGDSPTHIRRNAWAADTHHP
jgi:AraC-like DNA-binding protein